MCMHGDISMIENDIAWHTHILGDRISYCILIYTVIIDIQILPFLKISRWNNIAQHILGDIHFGTEA